MDGTVNIIDIIIAVKKGYIRNTVTSIVPTTKDVLSAYLILEHFSSMDNFHHKFVNTFLWLQDLQKKENWHLILQDFLFLVWECK